MESTRVNCPNCSFVIPASDINIAALVAKCAECNHVFRLPIDDSATRTVEALGTLPSRPSGIVHAEGPTGELYIKRSWFHPTLIFLLFFCIAWDGFLVFWYAIAFGAAANGAGGDVEWMMVLFPICHVAVGVGLTYYVIAGFFNSTQIFIDDDTFYVRHRPIPWWGNRQLARSEIQGIESEESYRQDRQPTVTVSAHHVDGRQIVLLSSIKPSQADYIAHAIAAYLSVPYTKNDHPSDRVKPLKRIFTRNQSA